MRILIAEDEPKVAGLEAGLGTRGYGVSVAATGGEADRRAPIRLPE